MKTPKNTLLTPYNAKRKTLDKIHKSCYALGSTYNERLSTMKDYLFILDSVSGLKDGGTVGQINKPFPNMTRGQVQRVLDAMEEVGMVWMEIQPYGRTGKKVYRITEFAAMMCSGIARNYTGA